MESKAEGTFDLVATLQKNGRKTDADWTWTLGQGLLANPNDQMMWWVENPPEPLIIAGIMKGGLHQDELQLKTDIHVRHLPFFSFDLTTPVHLDRDWEFSSPPGRSFGFVKANGQLEDLFDFLDLGMHRVSGKINCDLQISHAQAKGTCTLQNGAYENYITGTELINISAALEGSGDNLILKHLTASDLNLSEVLTAKGMIHLSLQDLFPFHFDVKFDHLNVVQIDLVTASAEGHVSIDGNLASTLAAGAVQITRGDIAIPRHISRSYPDLQVIYKHRPITPVIATSSKPPYPLGLDLTVKAPKAIFINGRGLNSEWSGEFAVGGTYAEPAVTGSLELIEGEFSFAGRRFKLNQGSLTMQGNQYKLPLIDLTATTTEQAISITARLKGPINRPQLTFQSLPPLPLSSILSYLLFGKSLSDVTGLQALQLAGTVASVAGEGPDILEMTRKSLGVDRLQIVMTPTKSGEGYEGKETISLQVGKVITPGVIVTIKQSAEDSNPDIGVEVDLTHGFVLEVESQQQPEQGKFSLKWNVNY
jgi:translocation and assembly module TamB